MSIRGDIIRTTDEALDQAGLAAPGTVLLAAVSGGADSVAMLRALSALAAGRSLRVVAAHLHHGIRPEADGDADFVHALCERLAIDLYTERIDVPAAARASGQSIEMQARAMRYDFLRQVKLRIGAAAILTAHTRDDQAETLLLNLCRGAGPAALGGIPPDTVIKGCRLVRPLLRITRRDIEAYLQSIGQDWREDASNQDTAYRRNAVRHRILPLLQELLNPQAADALARAADVLYAENQLLEELTAAQRASVHPDDEAILWLEPFRPLPLALRRRLLATWLRDAAQPQQVRFDLVERIDALARQTEGGGCIRVSPTLEIRHEYDRLRRYTNTHDGHPPAGIPANAKRDFPTGSNDRREWHPGTTNTFSAGVELAIPGITPLPAFGCVVEVTIGKGFTREPSGIPGTCPAHAHIRYDAARPPCITVRVRQPGDRIAMIGMEGERKIQDILTDAKIPAAVRDRLPVFTIGDEVVWIPGSRPSRHWAVPSPTAPSLRLRVEGTGEPSICW
jgi:tRNA(Ile)-lysidine synthase